MDTKSSGRIEPLKRREDVLSDPTQMLNGVDKNMMMILAIALLSLGSSYYLFREMKKIKEDVNAVKNAEDNEELLEKVEQNSESVKAIETKLDQLITALNTRDRNMNEARKAQQQMAQQQMAQQQMQQQQQQQMQQQMSQQMDQQVNYEEDEIPVMGGKLGGSDVILL